MDLLSLASSEAQDHLLGLGEQSWSSFLSELCRTWQSSWTALPAAGAVAPRWLPGFPCEAEVALAFLSR